ncbi:MAG: AbgT family transporter [Roseibacillus sp.]|nr:AbgT family transporter [Roseibacillus sp.]
MPADSAPNEEGKTSGWLDRIERVGNRLPHPMTLFLAGTVIILILPQIADVGNWSAEKNVMRPNAEGLKVRTVETVSANGLVFAVVWTGLLVLWDVHRNRPRTAGTALAQSTVR